MNFEARRLLDLGIRSQINAQQLGRFRQVSLSMDQNLRSVYQCLRTIERRRTNVLQRLFHRVELLPVLIKKSQVKPCAGAPVTAADGRTKFLFSRGEVFMLLRNAGFHAVSGDWVDSGQRARLGFGLISTSPDNSGCLEVELSQIAARVDVTRVQSNRNFELAPHSAGKSGGGNKAGSVCLLTINSSQPQVKLAVPGGQSNRLLAVGNSTVPVAQAEISAAQKVMSLGVVGRGADLPMQTRDSLIDASIRDQGRGSFISPGCGN